jgi:hypothetical protein
MPIVFPLDHPTAPGFRSIRWTLRDVVATTRSPFTLQQEIQEFAGDSWAAQVSLPPMRRADADRWIAWLTALRGQAGTFHLGDPTTNAPKGSGPGAPVVAGTQAAGARTLATSGWTASRTGVLLAGDLIQIGTGATRRLHRVLTDTNSDASGLATLDIWPALRREGAPNATAIVVSNCKGTFRLASNDRDWDVGEAQFYGLGFSAQEAV